ncbi:MAG: MlaD family protein [Rikenellaceae bacterium]
MKKKKGISKELAIGTFVVVILVGGYFGFNFLKNRNVFGGDYYISAVFDQADGLEKGASVIIKGYKVGSIEGISLDMESQTLEVEMIIEGAYELPNNSTAKITSSSLLGGKVIDIQIGTVGLPILKSGDKIFASADRDLMDSMGDEFAVLKENLGVIVDKLNETLDGVNRTLSPENTEALSATFANLESTTSSLDKIMKSESKNIEAVISNLATLSESLSNSAPELERGISNLATLSDSLKVSAPSLISSATSSVQELESILTKISAGEGTAGKLVTDEELYVNINAALDNLALLLEDLKENPKKYINISVFGSKK